MTVWELYCVPSDTHGSMCDVGDDDHNYIGDGGCGDHHDVDDDDDIKNHIL